MGSIGTGSLTGGKTTTPKDFQIRLQDCNFNTETTMTTTFTGNPYSGNSKNYSLSNMDNGTEIPNVSLVIGDQRGTGYDRGRHRSGHRDGQFNRKRQTETNVEL